MNGIQDTFLRRRRRQRQDSEMSNVSHWKLSDVFISGNNPSFKPAAHMEQSLTLDKIKSVSDGLISFISILLY